mgnify:CR=1 FL=1
MSDTVHTIENLDELNSAARELNTVIKRYEYELMLSPDFIEALLNIPTEWDVQTVKDEWEPTIKTVRKLLEECHAERLFLEPLWGFNVKMSLLRLDNVEEKAKYFGCALAEAVQETEGWEQDND